MLDSEKPVVKDVGERIARLRRTKGWKQKELAARIGCTVQQISKLVRGHWMPRVSVLVRVGQTFNVTADYLLTGRLPRHPGMIDPFDSLAGHKRVC